MRLRTGSICITALATALLFLAGCPSPPKYPKCEKDEHCADKGEYCVQGQCQECGTDEHCAKKYPDKEMECVSGRCEEKPECRTDEDCEGGLVCRGNECVPECTEDADCPSGYMCEEQKCVEAPQQETEATQISSECQPVAATDDVIHLERVQFDFNDYDLTTQARSQLDQNAECLRQAPGVRVVLEGHADERGTQEYNLALGEKRANTVRNYLRNLGIDTSRMTTRSKGENEPLCEQDSESCFSRNRRVEFIQQRGTF